MPTYVFRCDQCQNVFERFISFANLANVAALPGVEQVTVDVLGESWRPPGQDYDWD